MKDNIINDKNIVIPGNIARYINRTDVFGLDSNQARFTRLLFQPVLVVWVLWATPGLKACYSRSKSSIVEQKNLKNMETNDIISSVKPAKETFRQKVLRSLYPAIRKLGSKGKNGTVLSNDSMIPPGIPFYDLQTSTSSGDTINFKEFTGKKVLIVNTASDCGYTGQYAELQSLHEKKGDTLVIIAFPANDFHDQEKSSDDEIAQFCKLNYGVTFPVARKGVVIKGDNQQQVFEWLTDKKANGWNEHEPDWNFSKYIVNEEGILTHYFGPSISPLEEDFMQALK